MSISDNIHQIKELIQQTERNNNRDPGKVLLLAVSKQQPVQAIIEAYRQGLSDFGENYLQEAQEKMEQLKSVPLCWHFIGPIQSNKTKGIATSFNWVHSIDRAKIATLLNDHRPKHLDPLQVCLQINLVDEESKSGIPPKQAVELALEVNKLPNLNLRGLMTIPPPLFDEQEQYKIFMRLNKLLNSLNHQLGLKMDTLSMGMTDDLTAAIKAGATIVRIGRAIFGERQGKTV